MRAVHRPPAGTRPCRWSWIAAAVGGAAVLAAGCAHAGQTGAPAPTASATAVRAVDVHTYAAPPTGPRGTPPDQQADDTVVRFATAWLQPHLPRQRWWSLIQPLCSRQHTTLLRGHDHTRNPAASVTGQPQLTDARAATRVYTLPTSAGTLTVHLVTDGGRWLVNAASFQPSGTATQAPQPRPESPPARR